MAPLIPTSEPAAVTAGTSWQWTRAFTDFPPADGWALTYYLVGLSSLSFAATSGVTDYAVHVLPATTAPVTPGTYTWTARLTKGSDAYDADSGELAVLPNAAVTAGSDQRTHAAKMVTLLESELEARITGTGSAHDDYVIGDRQMRKISTTELQGMLARYRFAAAREAAGGRVPPYEVTFARP